MLKTNLPPNTTTDSASATKEFFDSYYSEGISLSANDVDAVISFFETRGFDISAANSIAATLLSQAKIENVKIFQIIDTLKGLSVIQLNRVVSEILNYNRLNISILGYRSDTSSLNNYETRNLLS